MTAHDEEGEGGLVAPYRPGRRAAVRVLVPAGIAGVVAAGIGLVPALASDTAPSLPQVSAQQLVAKVLSSRVQSLSGTVEASADLGIPSAVLGGLGSAGSGGSGPFGGHQGHRDGSDGGRGGSSASPEAQLTQLLAGTHTLQVAVDGPDRQRLGLIDQLAEYEIVHNGTSLWAWDSRTNEAVHLTLPADSASGKGHDAPFAGKVPATPQEAAQQFLAMAGPTTRVTVAGTSRVAGQNAYELSVKPKQSGSTIGEVRIAVDADNGVPLRVVVTPEGSSTSAFDVHFTSVSFGKPGARTFDFSAPKGAKVTEQKATDRAERPQAKPQDGRQPDVTGEGWTAVAAVKLQNQAGRGGQSVLPLAKSLGKPVAGGSLISTRLINALVADNGTVYVGAVTPQVLEHAAGAR